MSRQTLSMSRQSLLYSLSLTELFVVTLNPLSRQIYLGSSHLSSIFYCDRKLLRRDRNLLLKIFYCSNTIFLCHDKDSCLRFFILSQHDFLCRNIIFVIFSTYVIVIFVFVVTKFTFASCCDCCDIKLLCHDRIFLSPIPGPECYVTI